MKKVKDIIKKGICSPCEPNHNAIGSDADLSCPCKCHPLHEEDCELNDEGGSFDGCTCAVKTMVEEIAKKLEDKNNELWEDGYSFGIYKVREMIEEIMSDGKVAYNKELDILKEKISKLKLTKQPVCLQCNQTGHSTRNKD